MNHTEECINYNDNSFNEKPCICNHKPKTFGLHGKYCKICKVVKF